MINRVENFAYNMIVNVFNAENTAPLAIQMILEAASYDPGPKAERIESPEEWTREKIVDKAKNITSDKGEKGDFED
jgi:fructose-bisphosphate aldolase class II